LLVGALMHSKRIFIVSASVLFLTVVLFKVVSLVGLSDATQSRPAGTPNNPESSSSETLSKPATVEVSESSLSDESSGEIKATLPLFHRVDTNYTRGAEPVRGGLDVLASLGVKTIVDLRSAYERTPVVASEAERVGIGYCWVPLSVWDPPDEQRTREFLGVVTDQSRWPVFVFCTDGVNRTGEMTAIYRMVRYKVGVEQAIKEMDDAGFSPYYLSLRNYVWAYARAHGLGQASSR